MNKILSLSLAATIPLIHAQAANAEYLNRPAVAADQSSGSTAGMNSSMSPSRFETVPPGEDGQIAEIISLTTQLQQMRYPNSMARRGVHPKDHGCLQASFAVNSDIPANYQVGVFATPGKTYPAWIRFSNATPVLAPDLGKNGPDSRGMAIKLMGVEGDTLLNEPGAQTQDFLLINLPGFAFVNVSEYLDVTKIQLANNDDIKTFFAPPLTPERVKTLGVVQRLKQTQLGNPLESRYFSASPFLLGKDKVAKFAVKPRDPTNTPIPPNPSPNYLREALKKSLDVNAGKPAVFDFQVQMRPDEGSYLEDATVVQTSTGQSLPIEDATAEWKEEIAPFQNVATITIKQQDFDNPVRITECEHLVFTPWHGLAEHQPLGGINRLRRGVYIASSQYRLETREPSGFPK
jgi:hypothetical protein